MKSSTPLLKKVRRPTQKQIEKAFAPFAQEIGQLARAWNALHDQLGQIFGQIVRPDNLNISRAIWFATQSDKAQRGMLRASSIAYFAINEKIHPKAKEDISWLLTKIDKLSDMRNNAIHAPIMIGMNTSSREMVIEPDVFYGNPRAINLKGKELLVELKWYRQTAEALRQFAILIWLHLRRIDGSWPHRPSLPTLSSTPAKAPSKTRKAE